jgi:FkbM family methyltransferase
MSEGKSIVMTTVSMRSQIKRVLPRPIATTAGRLERYVARLKRWGDVVAQVRGVTASDRSVLRRGALHAPFDMLRDLDAYREPTPSADIEVDVRGYGRFAVRGGSDDLAHVLASNHRALFSAMSAKLKPGDIAIDGGANIGGVTVFMAQCVGPKGKVIAVEMMPDTAALLRRNLALNALENVDVVEKALADTAGGVITARVRLGVFGQASITPLDTRSDGAREVHVPKTTLDAVCAAAPRIALIKIDLEGAEMTALAGATETLKKTDAIIFESWVGKDCPVSKLLEKLGFKISNLDGRNFLAERPDRATP